MPFYYHLKKYTIPEKRNYIVKRLLALRKQLDKEIPPKDLDHNLLIGTWNIRDFGKINRRGFGKRTSDSFTYIAEIISRFDIVAVQEVNELRELKKVMRILGPDWDYIASDVTDSSLGGNGERMTFVFDKRKVLFRNIAGQIVLPKKLEITKASYQVERIVNGERKLVTIKEGKQFRRTPYIVSFQSGWFKFDICTVHIYYGQGKMGMEQRVQEIRSIARYLKKVSKDKLKYKTDWKRTSTILLGDFNIIRPDHETMHALIKNGFKVPEPLQNPTNLGDDMYYDQIAFMAEKDVTDYIIKDPENNAGVFDFGKSIFRKNNKDDIAYYTEDMKASSNGKKADDLKKYYNTWRTYQSSDHKVLWTRLNTNDSTKYIKELTIKKK